MRAGPGKNRVVVAAALLVLGLLAGLALSKLFGALLVLISLGLFGYQASQSIKAAREREEEKKQEDTETAEG